MLSTKNTGLQGNKESFIVLAHNLRSAYNVGSLFRTADGAGVDHIVLGGYTPTPPRADISKTALGADTTLSWEQQKQPWRWLVRMKKSGFHIVALENNVPGFRPISLFKFKPQFPLILVLGNEVHGLSKTMLSYADTIIQIPMHGSKESLNVAIAFGIAAYYISNKKT